MSVEEDMYFYALENAVKFDGMPNQGAVIGKLLAVHPELKKDKVKMKLLAQQVQDVITQVKQLSVEEQLAELQEKAPELLEKKAVKEHDLFGFLNISDDETVVTAFPPGPEKYPHIGHAKAGLVNYELAKRHNGKFILRFEDTNPKLVQKQFYEVMRDNFSWLGLQWDVVMHASDHMGLYYEKAELLINKDQAYVCRCDGEAIKKSRMEGIACLCREQNPKKNMQLWHEMKTMDEGHAIVRLKIDLSHKNSAMRDPTIFRIIDAEHALQGRKYRVWPNYDFQNSIMDGFSGVTHRIRSKEFEMRNELQRHIQRLLGYAETAISEIARFNMEGVLSSGRVIREKIEKGELIGWDDPSLTTLVALRRRGFSSEGLRNFLLSTGLTKNEATLTWHDIEVHNRRVLDAECERYFFVADPVKLKVIDAPTLQVHVPVHPTDKDKGFRRFTTGTEFYISKDDVTLLRTDALYRFMDCFNFEKKGDALVFHSTELDVYKEKGDKIMHFLPVQDDLVSVHVVMPDKAIVKGLAEPLVSDLAVGSVIQFERFGFCRLDHVTDSVYVFWYAHR